METGNLAAIDLGTNSCRIRITDAGGNLLYRDSETVRLGEGMYARQCFTQESMERTLNYLAQCAEQMKNYRVAHYRAITTASCRMASNGEKFVQMAAELCGIKFDIISAEEEAMLNLRGARLNAAPSSPYVLVYDLGGGSTEITLATNENKPKILYTISIPWGARNASEAFDLLEYNQENADRLRSEIRKYALGFLHDSEFLMYIGQCDCIATSSTALRLMSMVWNTDGYERDRVDGMSAETARIDKAIDYLQHQTLEQLAQNKYIGKNRAPVMVAATVIFKEIYDTLQIKVLTSSLKGAQDAIIEDLRQKWQS